MKESPKSSTIKEINHDPVKNEMEIAFHSGSTYRYFDVPAEAHEAFKNAESWGKHFAAHVKPKFRAVKL